MYLLYVLKLWASDAPPPPRHNTISVNELCTTSYLDSWIFSWPEAGVLKLYNVKYYISIFWFANKKKKISNLTTTMWTNFNIVFGHNWYFSIGWGFAFSCTYSWTQDPSLMLLHFLDNFSSKVGLKFKLIMAGLSVIPIISFSVPRASCSIKMGTRFVSLYYYI